MSPSISAMVTTLPANPPSSKFLLATRSAPPLPDFRLVPDLQLRFRNLVEDTLGRKLIEAGAIADLLLEDFLRSDRRWQPVAGDLTTPDSSGIRMGSSNIWRHAGTGVLKPVMRYGPSCGSGNLITDLQ